MNAAETHTTIHQIAIDKIAPSPLNPRKHFDEAKLAELTESIRAKGVRSPLELRPGKKAGTFELIAGERRWRASQRAGLTVLPCLITECTDGELVELALTENGQREDLTPMDEARSYRAAMKADPKHYTVAVVAAAVGKSESYVYRRLKLLDLAAPLQEALDENRISIAHAERLVKLTSEQQLDAAAIRRGKFDGGGVVWLSSPLISMADEDKGWKPGLEDLQPIHALDNFIRNKTFFAPTSPDLKYLQPDLAEDIDTAVAEQVAASEAKDDEPLSEDEAKSMIVSVTTDSMARSRMGLKPNAPMPLTPSRWKEVKPGKECAHTQPGVITHGDQARVLKVCIAKGKCKSHWPVPPKKKANTRHSSSSSAVHTPSGPTAAELKRERARNAWRDVMPQARQAFVVHFKGAKATAALVRALTEDYTEFARPVDVEKEFAVKLTDATAIQVLALGALFTDNWDSFDDFARDAKRFGLKPDAVKRAFDAKVKELEAAEKAAAKVATPSTVKKAKSGKAVR